MSSSSGKLWSDSPNAPRISYSLYFEEKTNLAGDSIAAILYGVVAVLFLQCMVALFNPANRTRKGMKWGLVLHTVVMFVLVTVATGMGLNLQSIARIDNREFPADDRFPPGPLGYKRFIYTKAISLVPNLTFQVNQWLADGLLLYRCYMIYAMNYWVIAFPCSMYLTSLATGVVHMYQASLPQNGLTDYAVQAGLDITYYTVSFSLNVLLTSMIVTRLILHRRNIRNAMGASAGAGRLYGAVITMLVESSALYAVGFLLFFGPWITGSWVGGDFWSILCEVQVIAPLLITRRVAGRNALTSDVIVSGHPSSIRFRGLSESTDGGEILADGNPTTRSTGACGEVSQELGAGAEIIADKSTP